MVFAVDAGVGHTYRLMIHAEPTLCSRAEFGATGRELLRWLHCHAVDSVGGAGMAESVPDHRVEHLVELANPLLSQLGEDGPRLGAALLPTDPHTRRR